MSKLAGFCRGRVSWGSTTSRLGGSSRSLRSAAGSADRTSREACLYRARLDCDRSWTGPRAGQPVGGRREAGPWPHRKVRSSRPAPGRFSTRTAFRTLAARCGWRAGRPRSGRRRPAPERNPRWWTCVAATPGARCRGRRQGAEKESLAECTEGWASHGDTRGQVDRKGFA